MYGQPIRVQPFGGGFSGAKFNPMNRLGAFQFPASWPGFQVPSYMVPQSQVMPTFIAPGQQVPTFIAPGQQMPVFSATTAETSDTGKALLTVAATVGLLALGAYLF